MLVLSRDRGERIFIGKNREIVITLVRQSGTGAQIGIDAPKDMPIVREEVDDVTAQHTGPLEDDGGPPGSPLLAPTERVPIGEGFA